MIYFTGDTHANAERLSKNQLRKLNADDTLIVCGDFGFLWDNSKEEKKVLEKISKRKCTICFIDGTHENFGLLSSFPVSEWNGGKVHKITNNIFHLMRGQVFNIGGEKIFTMGGGENPESELKEDDEITSHHEIPTEQEMLEGVGNLEKNGYKVDYIVTHEPPAKIRDFLMLSSNTTMRVTALGAYFDELSAQADYKLWIFGSMHIDKFISSSQIAVFDNIIDAASGRKI